MKKLILLFIIFSVSAHAQKIPDLGLFKVRISESDKNISAEIKRFKSEPSIEQDRFYYWYSANKIKQTQGGYSGTLLNGLYQEFYLNKNLKQEGTFDKGLKDGTWKEWTEEGILIQSITWSDGIKNGNYELFDDKGILKQKGSYRNNLIHGKQYVYGEKGSVNITTYKAGKLQPPPKPSKFWKKINIFKKKNKPVKPTI
jgi:antitoxin component YwqK of YwqJK toxin-antitoxin module